MTATRLGILIGVAGAIAFLAWRVVDEYERELAQLRRRSAARPPYPTGIRRRGRAQLPIPDVAQPAPDGYGTDWTDEPDPGRYMPAATIWDYLPIALVIAVGVLFLAFVALQAVSR